MKKLNDEELQKVLNTINDRKHYKSIEVKEIFKQCGIGASQNNFVLITQRYINYFHRKGNRWKITGSRLKSLIKEIKRGGRPTVFDNVIVVEKLRSAFAFGATDEEACAYAGISVASLYNYQKKHPEFLEEKLRLKQRPILKARKTVVENLDDPKHAEWFLERKRKDEFSPRTELTGRGGKELIKKNPQAIINVLQVFEVIKDKLKNEEITKLHS